MNETMIKTKIFRSQFYRLFTKYQLITGLLNFNSNITIENLSPKFFFEQFKIKENRVFFMDVFLKQEMKVFDFKELSKLLMINTQ